MRRYEIIIENGDWPLRYTAENIADAYACLMEARKRSDWIELDPVSLMETLVDMLHAGTLRVAGEGYQIDVRPGPEERSYE